MINWLLMCVLLPAVLSAIVAAITTFIFAWIRYGSDLWRWMR